MADTKEVFELLDADGDGRMNVEEFGRAIRAVGHAPTEKEVREMYACPDGMTFADFKAVVSGYKGSNSRSKTEELRESLQVFDQDNSGSIAEPELRFLLSNMGEILTDTEVDQILKDAPKNKDGEINLESLLKMLVSM
mmetsp:Transcript_10369/g.18921  ORF Transcript_10369/g.18921 Transcript_10369/m.18921 type:complete len:138 (-) Transcript_10369:247-660(-)